MAILTKTRYVLAILFGFTTGIIGTVFYADTIIPEIEIREIETIKEVETVVEKLVQVDKIKIVEVPKVVYEVQIK
jgi:hypothetical protein